ncbi:MAG TPA: antiterminator LoaP [Clostridiaceae bacterium]|nr:antiterminator LoaP [Clostridiaceae bacterium]
MEKIVYNSNWYALFVKSGQENKVKERLEYKFEDKYRIIVPRRKLKERKGGVWSYVIRPLFPGYVLVNGEINIEDYYGFKNVPGLFKLLCSGREPARIEPYEMEVISRLISNSEIIGFSDVLVEDGKVIVVDGPLVSMEGRILRINQRKGRAQVMLNFMGEPRVVELGINVLQPV